MHVMSCIQSVHVLFKHAGFRPMQGHQQKYRPRDRERAALEYARDERFAAEALASNGNNPAAAIIDMLNIYVEGHENSHV
jgi:hypothetical protein